MGEHAMAKIGNNEPNTGCFDFFFFLGSHINTVTILHGGAGCESLGLNSTQASTNLGWIWIFKLVENSSADGNLRQIIVADIWHTLTFSLYYYLATF